MLRVVSYNVLADAYVSPEYWPNTPPECLDRAKLEAWLRNAPGMKAMAPDPGPNGLRRGMPNLGLSEPQIDELIAYLSKLS